MENEIILLDGAMGTMLQAAGLPMGQAPEVWNLTAPDVVADIQRRYVEAGSRVLYTNTFGANRLKTKDCGYSVGELVAGGVRCARRAAGELPVRVALDIGPIGQLLEPLGTLRFEEAYELFKEQVVAGRDAGADLIVIETMSDLYEVKAAVLAAKENSELPVWVTMTFEQSGRTFVGVTVPAMAMTLQGLGVDAMGFNCSLGPRELLPLVKELRQYTDKPLILKPNAGLPDPATGEYAITGAAFARQMQAALPFGVQMLGGCCGTRPDFIRNLARLLGDAHAAPPLPPRRHGVCSARQAVELSGVRVIGERINPTGKKRFQQALRENDIDYILARAIEQQDAGADILDVNVGLPGIDEPAMMTRVVKALQSVVDLPLQIDSSDPKALEAGLRVYNGKPAVNSVNGEPEVMDRILPLVKKYGASVVGLTLDSGGIPQTAAGRVEIAKRILRRAGEYGIPKEDLYIDCLTLTVSAQQEQAAETLRAVRTVREELGLQIVLGVSNISFGLPNRNLITQSFLTQAMHCGLTLPIINPNLTEMMDAVAAFRVLSGEDPGSADFIARFAAQPAQTAKTSAQNESLTLESAIMRGMKGDAGRLARELIQTEAPLSLVERRLIPALDRVGEEYEKGVLFLPQLLSAAQAAQSVFQVIREAIAKTGEAPVKKGRLVIATVKGDIHDIGKNIVRTVLENYGYDVIDLGRDVAPEAIAQKVEEDEIRLVGLSALMTTTLPAMEETIRLLKSLPNPPVIMVGGAVVTPEYALHMQADYYANDAREAAEIAKKVLG